MFISIVLVSMFTLLVLFCLCENAIYRTLVQVEKEVEHVNSYFFESRKLSKGESNVLCLAHRKAAIKKQEQELAIDCVNNPEAFAAEMRRSNRTVYEGMLLNFTGRNDL